MIGKVKIDPLDRICTKAVRLREKNICQNCGKYVTGQNSHCAHIMSRRHMSTRYYLPNLLHLCFQCHRYWHSEVSKFELWVRGLIGDKEYDKLLIMSRETWDKDNLKWGMYLKEEIKRLEEEFSS